MLASVHCVAYCRIMQPVNGEAVKALREAYGWSGTHFAHAIDISPGHLSNLECGTRTVSPTVARKIADTLGVPLAAITSTYPLDQITDKQPKPKLAVA